MPLTPEPELILIQSTLACACQTQDPLAATEISPSPPAAPKLTRPFLTLILHPGVRVTSLRRSNPSIISIMLVMLPIGIPIPVAPIPIPGIPIPGIPIAGISIAVLGIGGTNPPAGLADGETSVTAAGGSAAIDSS